MTKNEIIEKLFLSEEFNRCIQKMEPADLREDLKSEIALILLELPEERVIDLHQSGALKFFAVKVIINQARSTNSKFYMMFRRRLIVMQAQKEEGLTDRIEREERERIEDQVMQEVANLDFYDREILMLYGKLGSYRKLEAATGIPWESTYCTAKNAIKKIRQKVSL